MQKKEVPIRVRSYCSNTFWKQDFNREPKAGLFHFDADIGDTPVDNSSLTHLISIDVVQKLHLHTTTNHWPYMLTTNDHQVPITKAGLVPITIYGHTIEVTSKIWRGGTPHP
jgi:hypothetical protein